MGRINRENAMTDKTDHGKYLWLFFVFTFIFSWVFWIPNALLANGVMFSPGLEKFVTGPFNPAAFGPLVAALIVVLLEQGWKGAGQLLKKGLDFRFRKTWLLPIFLLLPLLFGGGILVSILLGKTRSDWSVLSNPAYALVGFFVILLTGGPLQEEFGWRGYALPRLQSRYTALTSSLILGFFWWLWHLPAVFIPGRFMTNSPVLFAGLAVVIMLTSILFTWIYNNTYGSVLATMLFHASMNWSIWSLLPSMQVNFSIIAGWIILLLIAAIVIVRIHGSGKLSRVSK
jgi:uncharacterized protein